jgi:hypothetical protein
VYIEVRTPLRAVVTDFFFNCWCREIPSDNRIVTVITFLRSVRRLLVTAEVPSSSILVTLVMEALRSSGTSVYVRATRRNIPVDGIVHSHRRENLKSYIALTCWTL